MESPLKIHHCEINLFVSCLCAKKVDVWSYSIRLFLFKEKHLLPSFPSKHNAVLCGGHGVGVYCVWSGARSLSCEAT